MIIKLKDYERIFQIISAVIESEEGSVAHACVHYSLFGATILGEHFGLDAKVRCGLAIYHVGDDGELLCFGERMASGIISTSEGFHCWVEADGWALDFMAPNFTLLKRSKYTSRPKMFQKKLADMAQSPDEMTGAGQFFLMPNPELLSSMLKPVVEHPGIQDLAGLCSQWFKKTPKNIPSSAATADQNGRIRPISLTPVRILSRW